MSQHSLGAGPKRRRITRQSSPRRRRLDRLLAQYRARLAKAEAKARQLAATKIQRAYRAHYFRRARRPPLGPIVPPCVLPCAHGACRSCMHTCRVPSLTKA